ncbi:MAG: hypothetical protein JW795_05365 [Chitinivibrionales bacterium]|nr:hypothetical protein [Chitinivibrionales bacterium]
MAFNGVFFWLAVLLSSTICYADTLSHLDTKSSVDKSLSPPAYTLFLDEHLGQEPVYDYRQSIIRSALFPGAGQWYCDQPARGFSFLAPEIGAALYSINRAHMYGNVMNDQVKRSQQLAGALADSLQFFAHNQTLYLKYYEKYLSQTMSVDLLQHQQKMSKLSMYHGIEFMMGLYLWNMMDALSCSNAFNDTKPRKPATAVLYALIPYLGLGQLYNQSFWRAGFVWTSQTLFTIMAYDQNTLLNECRQKRNQVNATKLISNDAKRFAMDQWNSELNSAFRMRNTWLWLLFFSYFYSIFDALVDAHLHDYPINMQIEPHVQQNDLQLNISWKTNF